MSEKPTAQKSGAQIITDERLRQQSEEGYTSEHDDQHDEGEIATAAWCYSFYGNYTQPPSRWPWGVEWWKPTTDRVRRYAKAGALWQAEIDRLTRLRDQCAKEIDTELTRRKESA